MKEPIKIQSEQEYEAIMRRIDEIMKKGSAHITKEEGLELRTKAEAAQAYEQEKYGL